MNSNLNVFKTYSKENREYQLENDLTKAFAICMQEDALFFHEILRFIFRDSNYFEEFFYDLDANNEINISIQKFSKDVVEFDHIYAISLTGKEMSSDHFWNQSYDRNYDPISDIVIQINNIALIIEAKRDVVDCASQLYNQIFNIFQKTKASREEMESKVTPLDLNWLKLMDIAVKVFSFEKATGTTNRFLEDFIHLIKGHNFRWLPEPALISLSPNNTAAISRRFESVFEELDKREGYSKLDQQGRLGLKSNKPWANEIHFRVREVDKVETGDEGNLVVAVYPGNTKAQGASIFHKEPKFRESVTVNGTEYPIEKLYHIKFFGQRYIAGLWFDDKDLNMPFYTQSNFNRYAGKSKRGVDWEEIEILFDQYFKDDFNWRKKCNWDANIINSNRTVFNLTFGFELSTVIPFAVLKAVDTNKSDLSELIAIVTSVHEQFNDIVI